MRDDVAENEDGLGCTIDPDGVEDNFSGDGMIYRRVRAHSQRPSTYWKMGRLRCCRVLRTTLSCGE